MKTSIVEHRLFRPTFILIWLGYAAALFVATHMPIPESAAPYVAGRDKVIHMAVYFVLGGLTGLVFLKTHPLRLPTLSLISGLWLYAGLDEVLQGLTRRHPDAADWAMDATGAALAIMLLTGLIQNWESVVTRMNRLLADDAGVNGAARS